jgi:[acyl-carrier-protein] S-malonyltransferase
MDKVAYLFPGQGSQYVGMGQALYDAHPEARQVFEEAEDILGMPLARLCFEGPAEVLTDTVNAQPAILTTSMASLAAMRAQDVYQRPAFVAGHSMGEFSALVASGSIRFIDALQLVRERGRLMKLVGDQNPGGMAAIIGLEAARLAEICERARQETGGVVQIANDNCPGQIVISGDKESLARALEEAKELGARKVIPLAVSIASHSPLMQTITKEFASAVDAAPISEAAVPIVANVSAAPIMDAQAIREELKAQLISSVRWTESMRYLLDQGVTRVVEIGPKEVLAGLMRRIDRKVDRINYGETAVFRD